MKFFKLFSKVFFVAFFVLTFQANAVISLKVNNEAIEKNRILFFGFDSEDEKLQQDIDLIFSKITKNLRTTDLFQVIKQKGTYDSALFSLNKKKEVKEEDLEIDLDKKNQQTQTKPAANSLSVEAIPDFEKYLQAKIGAIIVGQFDYNEDGNLEVRIRMWDVLDKRQLFGKFYIASTDNYVKLANIVSNEVYKAITGEKIGHFDSEIIYVSETGSFRKRIKKIITMNFDGSNRKVLTSGKDLVLTPIFAKEKNKAYYLRYFQGRPQIFSLDLTNLETIKVGGFRGTTFSAGKNPRDSNKILLSAIIDGNSDIYELDIAENIATRLTKSNAIDTTPSYSPDGEEITFSSDRNGAGQQIYVMSDNGTSVKRISSKRGSYSKPVWSPDGSLIAFTKSIGGKFYIGVMSPKGKGEKLLTSAYMAEGARWSPSGRYLIYSKKKGPYGLDSIPRLYVIDIITGHEIMLPTAPGEGASDPDWK